MKSLFSKAFIAFLVGISMGFLIGTVTANRRALKRAVHHIKQLQKPVNSLNAQDAVAIVALSTTPRFNTRDGVWEYIGDYSWINVSPDFKHEQQD